MIVNRRRLLNISNINLTLYTKSWNSAGTYSFTIPSGCTKIEAFLIGGGGGGGTTGGGSGYTKIYKDSTSGYRTGTAISVTPGQNITIIVGEGGSAMNSGTYSQVISSSYRAEGGSRGISSGNYHYGGDGGSGGGAYGDGGYNGGDGYANYATKPDCVVGSGQGYTTRDWGDSNGLMNAGGGGGQNTVAIVCEGGRSDYSENSGEDGVNLVSNGSYGTGGGGYGGGGGAARGNNYSSGSGGDGRVIIRYYAY